MKLLKNCFSILILVSLSGVFGVYYFYINGYNVLELPIYPKPTPRDPSVLSASTEARFYGMNVEMSQILPSSGTYVVNSKGSDIIDISAEIGINMFRITNETGGVYTKRQWYQVLDKMQKKNIKAIVLVEASSNNGDLYSIDMKPVYLDLVKTYILDSGVLTHPNVYGVDIKNEPLLTDSNIKLMREARLMIKSKFPEAKISIGWWRVSSGKFDSNGKPIYIWDDYEAGKKIDDIVDYYSVHLYGFETKMLGFYPDPVLRTKQFLTRIKSALQTNKPIIIEEFGASNGGAVSDTDTIGSPELQANTYNGVFNTLLNLNDPQFVGAVGFQFYSRDKFNDAWAIIKDKGEFLFPSAKVIQTYALDLNKVDIYPIKNDSGILLNKSHNGKRVGAKVNDRVGIKIELPTNLDYKIIFSKDNNSELLDPFHLRESNRNYYSLFQLKKAGDLKIYIMSRKKCVNNTKCGDYNKVVFSTSLIIR